MSDSSSSSSGGIGLFGMMFIVFMTLKLTGYIDWSWWLVTAPLWGGFTFVLLIGVVAFAVIYHLDKKERERDSLSRWLGRRR